jgi:hypothetical protein
LGDCDLQIWHRSRSTYAMLLWLELWPSLPFENHWSQDSSPPLSHSGRRLVRSTWRAVLFGRCSTSEQYREHGYAQTSLSKPESVSSYARFPRTSCRCVHPTALPAFRPKLSTVGWADRDRYQPCQNKCGHRSCKPIRYLRSEGSWKITICSHTIHVSIPAFACRRRKAVRTFLLRPIGQSGL